MTTGFDLQKNVFHIANFELMVPSQKNGKGMKWMTRI